MGRNVPSPCLDVWMFRCDSVRFGWRIWAFGLAGFNKSRARRQLCFNLHFTKISPIEGFGLIM